MQIIKKIPAKDLFGIKMTNQAGNFTFPGYAWNNPDRPESGTLSALMVVASWNHQEKAFNVTFISQLGVNGAYQVVRFNSRKEAEEFIDTHKEEYFQKFNRRNRTEDLSEFEIFPSKGEHEYMQVPIVGWDKPVWVNKRKWEYMSDKQKEQAIEDAPQFFGPNADREQTTAQRPAGFDFGGWRK